jgi:hypothetical protein
MRRDTSPAASRSKRQDWIPKLFGFSGFARSACKYLLRLAVTAKNDYGNHNAFCSEDTRDRDTSVQESKFDRSIA